MNLTAPVWNSYISVLKKHSTSLKANKLSERILIFQIACHTSLEQDTSNFKLSTDLMKSVTLQKNILTKYFQIWRLGLGTS